MPTIDADAHVIETPVTWEYMDKADIRFQPVTVTTRDDVEIAEGRHTAKTEFWAIDGKLIAREQNIGVGTTDAEARELRDIDKRLAHMDELSIDVQVLYPSLFLTPTTRNPEVELALFRSYNRWLADIWKKSKGRLRWVAMAPLQSLSDPAVVRDELAFCKENGACGIFMCGFSCDREIWNDYFYPFYKIAQELDLAICFHAGIDSMAVHDFLVNGDGLAKFKYPVISAFHSIIMRGLPERFPGLRWGFIESGSAWIPYVLGELDRRFKRRGRRFYDEPLKRNNMWVACQVTEDLDYIVKWAGEDQLVVGTDYGHNDTSTEIEAMRLLKDNNRLSGAVLDKILGDNPTRLYGLT